MAMKLTFLKAKYGIEFKLPEKTLDKVKEIFGENKKLAIYCAVQFREHMGVLIELLEKAGYETITSKPYRTSVKGQILGCDSYADSLKIDLKNVDGFIYVGDGYFHPNALLLAQENEDKIKPVLLVNLVQQILEVIAENHISKYLKKKKGNLLKFHTSKDIGVFVSSKWGQEYKDSALKLPSQYPEKNFYFFAGDNFSDYEMENFPFIECWVNTACPRIGQDDILRHSKPVVNIKDIWKTEFILK
ncbi:MAG: diphthamide synthesis protein [Nanoarchaeota archaeon]